MVIKMLLPERLQYWLEMLRHKNSEEHCDTSPPNAAKEKELNGYDDDDDSDDDDTVAEKTETYTPKPDVIVEHSLFDALDEDPDDTEFREELAQDFFQNMDTTLSEMKTFLENKDYVNLKDISHKEKSGALTLGFFRIANVLQWLEHCGVGKIKSSKKIAKQIDSLELRYIELGDYLEEKLGISLLEKED